MASEAGPGPGYTLAQADLDHALTHGGDVWETFRGTRVFITGGTGFFGQWLVETLAYAGRALDLGVTVVVLTREPARALARRGGRLPAGVQYVAGDVRTFEPPPDAFDWCVHAATEASVTLNAEAPGEMIATTVDGTRRILAVAARQPALRGLLACSSGAIYGRQPPELSHMPETHPGGPDVADPAQAYSEGKRLAELLGAVAARDGLPVKTARCFAFVGPWLPLDAHFAIGNFLRDRLDATPIALTGDGTAVRSYLHAADLTIWLWTILVRGASGRPYNVGSEQAVSIYDLACLVAEGGRVTRGREPVPGAPAARYVPCTRRARDELGLREHIALPDAVTRTARWYAGRRDRVSSG